MASEEDTPDNDRDFKRKKRSDLQYKKKTPPRSSKRAQRSPISAAVPVLDLDEDETSREESKKKKRKIESESTKDDKKKKGKPGLTAQHRGASCSSSNLPFLDRLREELSCAICLEICFEPSTTSCGHSFCKKCLRATADKCGERCPKCRQLVSNGRCCSVNTAIWNTIQLLFPQEVEARKAAGAPRTQETEHHCNLRNRSIQTLSSPEAESQSMRREGSYHPISAAVPVLDLDEDETSREESKKKKRKIESESTKDDKKKKGKPGLTAQHRGASCSSSNLPFLDRLREELSCAICLEICFEPSTTSCGRSFCKKCLCAMADKFGERCPKYRQLISSGRCFSVNTALWNTIQLLFSQEVEARKATGAPRTQETEHHYNLRNRSIQAVSSPETESQSMRREGSYHEVSNRSTRRSRRVPSLEEDAALTRRLQKEEFMEAFCRRFDEQYRNSLSLATRTRFRAMASRAFDNLYRGPPT